MATVSQNIATITAQAAILDGLIADFRAAKAIIGAAAIEIHKAQPGQSHHCRAGRLDLVTYAHSMMMREGSDTTVVAMATDAWAGVS